MPPPASGSSMDRPSAVLSRVQLDRIGSVTKIRNLRVNSWKLSGARRLISSHTFLEASLERLLLMPSRQLFHVLVILPVALRKTYSLERLTWLKTRLGFLGSVLSAFLYLTARARFRLDARSHFIRFHSEKGEVSLRRPAVPGSCVRLFCSPLRSVRMRKR
jgi:hypothetical protein